MKVKIYLAGKILKGAESAEQQPDWRQGYMSRLSRCGEYDFISPENSLLDESDPLLVFGHDCHLVRSCDVVIVDAPMKLGVGTAQEMVIAKYFRKYVYTVLPQNSHHRRSNLQMYGAVVEDWVHPFVYAFSDQIFDGLEELAGFFMAAGNELLGRPMLQMDRIDTAISRYEAFCRSMSS